MQIEGRKEWGNCKTYPRRDGVDQKLEGLASLIRINLHEGLSRSALLNDHDEHVAERYCAQKTVAQAKTSDDL